MNTMLMLVGSALLLASDGAMAQPQPVSPTMQANPPMSCPMAGSDMGAGMMRQGRMGDMQQMQAMHTQWHNDMQAMRAQMATMSTEMQAMHQEMMKMHQGMPKHH